MLRFSRNIFFTALFVALAVLARGWNLWNRGILEHDEGHALLNANTWHHIMRWVISGGPFRDNANAMAQLRDELHRDGGTLYSAGKFGYSLLLALATLPGQVSQFSGLILAWIGGIAVCGFAALLTWQYSRNAVAAFLTLAGCLASPLLLYLSREVSGTVWALALALGAACAIQAEITAVTRRVRIAWGITGGLALGYAFTCHYNIAPFILAIFLATAVQVWQRRPGTRSVVQVLWVPAAASLLVLAIFESVTQVIDYRLREIFPEYRSFLGELHHLFFTAETGTFKGQAVGDGVIGYGAEAWLYYAAALAREGLLFFGGLLVLPFIVKRIGIEWRVIASALLLLLVPTLFWAAYAHRVERVLGMVIVAGYIVSGLGYGTALERRPDLKLKLLPVFMALLVLTGFRSVRLLQVESPIPQVVEKTLAYQENHGGRINAGSFHPGFGPLWKWTIVERTRKPQYQSARTLVDFSSAADPDILFVDPETTKLTPDFQMTRQQIDQAQLITRIESDNPRWIVEARQIKR